jgi:hypothetical protein
MPIIAGEMYPRYETKKVVFKGGNKKLPVGKNLVNWKFFILLKNYFSLLE